MRSVGLDDGSVSANPDMICSSSRKESKVEGPQSKGPGTMLSCRNSPKFLSPEGFRDLVEDEHPLNNCNGRNSISVIEDGLTLPKYFIKESDVQSRVFSRKSEKLKRDVGRDEARDIKASGTDLVRCPFCRELYMVANQLKFLVCPNINCCKHVRTSCKDFEHSVDREGARAGRKEELISFKRPVDPAGKQTDEAVVFGIGTALPARDEVIRCSSCEGKILKFGGCNRLICFCGQMLCYMCREYLPKNSKFEHFCHHERYHSGFPCKLCKLCDLYEAQAANVRRKEERFRYNGALMFEQEKKFEDIVAQRARIKASWFSST